MIHSPSPSSFEEPKPTSLSTYVTEGPISALLLTLLTRANLTIKDAAQLMGVSHQSVSQYLNDRRLNPSIRWLNRFAAVCGATIYIQFPPSPNGD